MNGGCGTAIDAFTREDTRVIKGVAVVLMLIHHLWAFPDRLPVEMQLHCFGVMVNDTELMYAIGGFGKICVAIFMFLGGYGLWKKTRSAYSLTGNLIRLYKALWKVAIFFVPIGIIFFSHQMDYANDTVICHVFEDTSLKNIILNFLALCSSYNREWWFFETYLGAMVIGYIFIFVDKINNFWLDAFIVALIEIITQKILPVVFGMENYSILHGDLFYVLLITFHVCVCSFFMGIIFAKYNALVHLRERFAQVVQTRFGRLIVSVIGGCVIFICRQFGIGEGYDMLYVPFMIMFCMEWFDAVRPLRKLFGVFGKHSTNIWLIHSFYCYYFYPVARLVCWSQNPFVSLLALIVMSLISSVALDAVVGMVCIMLKK